MVTLRGVAVTGAFILGGLAMAGAIGHWIGVTLKAIEEHRGYDVRLGDMLAIGLLVFVLGGAMVVGAWQAGQLGGRGLLLASAGSALLALLLIVLWPVVFTGPEGSVLGGLLTVMVYGAEAIAAFSAR